MTAIIRTDDPIHVDYPQTIGDYPSCSAMIDDAESAGDDLDITEALELKFRDPAARYALAATRELALDCPYSREIGAIRTEITLAGGFSTDLPAVGFVMVPKLGNYRVVFPHPALTAYVLFPTHVLEPLDLGFSLSAKDRVEAFAMVAATAAARPYAIVHEDNVRYYLSEGEAFAVVDAASMTKTEARGKLMKVRARLEYWSSDS